MKLKPFYYLSSDDGVNTLMIIASVCMHVKKKKTWKISNTNTEEELLDLDERHGSQNKKCNFCSYAY